MVDEDEQEAALQKDLDSLAQWAFTWQMQFNVGKCKVLHLGPNNICREYTMGSKAAEVTEEEKDLGVLITNKFKPGAHVAKAPKKPMKSYAKSLVYYHTGIRSTSSSGTQFMQDVIWRMPCRVGWRLSRREQSG